MTHSVSGNRTIKRVRLSLAAIGCGLLLSATAAQANFRGGGTLFAFTEACQAHGFQQNGAVAVMARYVDTAVSAGQNSSQVSLALPHGTYHYALWQTSMSDIGPFFRGGAGRSIFSAFHYAANRPQIRVVQRQIVSVIDPDGPRTIENARSVVLRLRIQNFSDLPGCSATFAATMRH